MTNHQVYKNKSLGRGGKGNVQVAAEMELVAFEPFYFWGEGGYSLFKPA